MRISIILIGMKGCGKSAVGRLLAKKINQDFIEIDEEIEKIHRRKKKEKLMCREIFEIYGADYFRSLEKKALALLVKKDKKKQIVLACGGGTPLDSENQKLLRQLGEVIFLDADEKTLLLRILTHGTPAFFPYPDNPKKSLAELLRKRRPIYEKIADQIIRCTNESPEELAEKIGTIVR